MDDNEFKISIGGGRIATYSVEYRFAGESGKVPPTEFVVTPADQRLIDVFVGMLSQNRLRYEKEFQVLGEVLFSLLFLTNDRENYNDFGRKLKDAIQNSDGLLRIVLEFIEQQPVHAVWPWEYLYWPERPNEAVQGFFLAQRTELLLSRHVVLLDAKGLPPADPPLRLLFVAPSPKDKELKPVEAEVVREDLYELSDEYREAGVSRLKPSSLPPIDVSPERSGIVTYQEFVSRLRSADPHVIHFVGHGRYFIGEDGKARGQLAFTTDDGSIRWINDKRFAEDVARAAPKIRLVVLQACESAETGRSQSYQAVSGVARWLSQMSIPAVVAMHYQLLGRTGNLFSRAFYRALAERLSVGEAMARARQALYDNENDMPLWRSFGLPVLYLRDHANVLSPTESVRPSSIAGATAQPPAAAYRCPYDGAEFDPAQEEYFCSVCKRPLVCQEPDRTDATQLCRGIRRKQGETCLKCNRPWRTQRARETD